MADKLKILITDDSKLLRKKLDSVGGGSLIQTIRGVGYKLETE